MPFDSIESVRQAMEKENYIADDLIATTVFLALRMKKPLLIEGEPGSGKTEIAKVLARMLDTELIRLQCYEGLDANMALYEWDYPRQMLRIRMGEASQSSKKEMESEIFSERYLLKRPLLKAITHEGDSPAVLLIDEVDRCLTGDTLVKTIDGLRPISELNVNDKLILFDPRRFNRTIGYVKKKLELKAERILRIFVGGRVIKCTPNHRFVVFDLNGTFKVVRASELQLGQFLPLDKELYLRETPPDLEIRDAKIELSDEDRELIRTSKRQSGLTHYQLAETIGLSAKHLQSVLSPKYSRNSLRARALRVLCEVLGLNFEKLAEGKGLVLDNGIELFEMLGYIVGDGTFTSDRLEISDKDFQNIDTYAQKFRHAFGMSAKVSEGPHQNWVLEYWSLPLGRFLRKEIHLGRSRERRIPDFLYKLPKAERAAFLRGVFDAEGTVGNHFVSMASSSEKLVVGVQLMLSSLGVDSYIYRVPKKGFASRESYELMIYNTDRFAFAVGFCSPAKKAALARLGARKFKKTELVPFNLVQPILRQVRERGGLEAHQHHQTVYDIEGRRVKPNVNSLERLRLLDPKLGEIVERKLVLGRIARIESVEGPHEVYDITVEGPTPYFVANQVVTHNSEEEFEGFLLEVLSDFQVTIPEIGTIASKSRPVVCLTSNESREIGDALKRRCLYLYIHHPTLEKEYKIIRTKVPDVPDRLAHQICSFMQEVRSLGFIKKPGIAETLDWASALLSLSEDELDLQTLQRTLSCIVKHKEDFKKVNGETLATILTEIKRKREVPAHGK